MRRPESEANHASDLLMDREGQKLELQRYLTVEPDFEDKTM